MCNFVELNSQRVLQINIYYNPCSLDCLNPWEVKELILAFISCLKFLQNLFNHLKSLTLIKSIITIFIFI